MIFTYLEFTSLQFSFSPRLETMRRGSIILPMPIILSSNSIITEWIEFFNVHKQKTVSACYD